MTGNYSDLADKTVVVTGGSRGIGAQTARAFAAQGARVCIVGRDDQALAGVRAELGDSSSALSVVADVTSATALDDVRAQVESRFGPADVLAAFAGGQGRPVPSRPPP